MSQKGAPSSQGGLVLLMLVLFFVSIPFNVLFRGLVIKHVWLWHMVPLFNVRVLSTSQSISLSLVVSALTYHDVTTKKSAENSDDAVMAFIKALLWPVASNAFILFFAWVVHTLQA